MELLRLYKEMENDTLLPVETFLFVLLESANSVLCASHYTYYHKPYEPWMLEDPRTIDMMGVN